MAPPAGTLRVGRYFTALALLLAVLYAVVGFGSRHVPKLGLDLVGGIRVVFAAQTPQGAPAPTPDQMSQARQILEDRINSTGVTGSTVVVQGADQLVVEIPNGTDTDVAALGKAAILNIRGVMAPAAFPTCISSQAARRASRAASASAASPNPSSSAPGSSAGASTSGASTSGAQAGPGTSGTSGSAASSAPATSAGGSAASSTSSVAPQGLNDRPLQAPRTSSGSAARSSSAPGSTSARPASSAATGGSATSTRSATTSTTPSGTGTSGVSATPSASSTAAAPSTCSNDPFSVLLKQGSAERASLEKLYNVPDTVDGKPATAADLMPNAEYCPSPGIDSSDCRAYSSLSSGDKTALTTAQQTFDCTAGSDELDQPDQYYIACDPSTGYVYLLGHVLVRGNQIDSAATAAPDTNSVEYTVNLTFNSAGANVWNAFTSQYNVTTLSTASTNPAQCGTSTSSPCSVFAAFTLDGQVISAPYNKQALGANTQISGNFTHASADALTQELNYGKLPISFQNQENLTVSATLGTQQLKAAFLAGGIGLILVVLYSLIYYRALGLVTIASLLVSAGLTYALLVILGTQLGYTLDLAGIAGFIVALGITADSFVVFFERLKDEVHEGRSARVAVPRAWVRARRTILSADTVSFLAAAILYFFASADVKGFAFTLGLSTILDLVVVFLFTHPIVSLFSRSAAFGSARFTGLNAIRKSGGFGGDTSTDAPPARRPRTTRSNGSPTVVIEQVDDLDDDLDDDVDDDVDGDLDGEDVVDDDGARDVAPEPRSPRRRTTPQAGSAAERAAARRARLRQQAEDGDSGTDGPDNGETS